LTVLRGAAMLPRMATTILDLTGLKCPLPALKTGRALATLAPGGRLEVHCTDPMAAIDIPHLVQERGDVLAHSAQDGPQLVFVIEKAA
jgi:tRNA 2-thiouridine synthesizing protein A